MTTINIEREEMDEIERKEAQQIADPAEVSEP